MIAHFADLQLGYDYAPHGRTEWRWQDVYRCFYAMIRNILERQCTTVLFVGDIFHSSSPRRRDLFEFQNGLRHLSNHLPDDAQIIVISGNHDTPKTSGDIHPLQLFEHIPKVLCLFRETTTVETPDGKVLAVPWVWGEPVGPLAETEADILAVHAPVMDYLPEAARESQVRIASAEWSTKFRYVALGDIHQRIEVFPNMVFPGSLEHTSFGEMSAVCGGAFVDLSDSSKPPVIQWWNSPARAMVNLAIVVNDEDHYRKVLGGTIPENDVSDHVPLVRLTVSGLDPTMVDLAKLAKQFPTVKTIWANSPEPPVLSSFSPSEVIKTWETFATENQLPNDVRQLGQDALQAATENQ